MEPRIDYRKVAPGLLPAVLGLEEYLAHSGLEENLYHLVKLRASQVNGWADCIDMHWKDLRALGETEQRLYGLDAWEDPISNVPGKSLVAVEVSYPPGGASAPHHHSAVV